jgi:hypothetical protein
MIRRSSAVRGERNHPWTGNRTKINAGKTLSQDLEGLKRSHAPRPFIGKTLSARNAVDPFGGSTILVQTNRENEFGPMYDVNVRAWAA